MYKISINKSSKVQENEKRPRTCKVVAVNFPHSCCRSNWCLCLASSRGPARWCGRAPRAGCRGRTLPGCRTSPVRRGCGTYPARSSGSCNACSWTSRLKSGSLRRTATEENYFIESPQIYLNRKKITVNPESSQPRPQKTRASISPMMYKSLQPSTAMQ